MTKPKMFTLLLDEQRDAAYRAAASKAELTLAAWICQQCDKQLPTRAAAKLTKRRGRGKPRKDSQ